eukprot:Skav230173  [mRNA]  locus=scaffold196:40524:43745:- [translate_table: standard]
MASCSGELPVILSMPSECDQRPLSDKMLELSQKAALVMYFCVDHVGWWKQVHRGVKSGSKTIQHGLKWLAVSSFISVVIGLRKIREGEESQKAGQESALLLATTSDSVEAASWNILRDALVAVQALHLSRLMDVGDAIVGVLGMTTSIMDVWRVWPGKEPAQKQVPAITFENDRVSMKRQGSSEWRAGQPQACRLRNARVAPAAI